MDIADVRKEVLRAIDRAKRAASERRTRMDEASRDYLRFLDDIAVPLFRQIANALKAEGYTFNVFTPSRSVRLMSDKNAEDYIELVLDESGDHPHVLGRSSRGRGHRVVQSERPIGKGVVADLTDEDVLRFVMEELGPYVER
jgi:hypothetical protein